ncbi:recombinase RecT [Loktanella atrilutea]|nr:recombinase RecT [Loktanella atrilutea]
MTFNADTALVMVPTDGRDLMDKANAMSTAGLMVKDIFRDNPGACAGLIMMCAPYRINPYQASWKCYQVKADAPLAFEAQLIMAMINTSAPIKGRLKYSFDGEGPTRRVTVSGVDRDSGEVLEYTSPMRKDIGVQNSPLWKNDPDQQLCYSGGRAWARRHYPEILMGVYDREELIAAPNMRDVTPADDDAPRTAAAKMQSLVDQRDPANSAGTRGEGDRQAEEAEAPDQGGGDTDPAAKSADVAPDTANHSDSGAASAGSADTDQDETADKPDKKDTDTSPTSDEIEAARTRGVDAHGMGMALKAVPGELRENTALAEAWQNGWKEARDAG